MEMFSSTSKEMQDKWKYAQVLCSSMKTDVTLSSNQQNKLLVLWEEFHWDFFQLSVK